ncbi:stage II sporulation protein M [Ethanoligenens sp.]|uniref:stage II sporulation protein M n=1 Tax=Ethanoligenens sp. TaxID=2099655 RepID=UPI0039EBF155
MTRKRMGHPTRKPVNTGNGKLFFPYFGLAVLILVGVMVGALLAAGRTTAETSGLQLLSQELLSKSAASRGFFDLFVSSFFTTAVLLCAAFLFGLWAVGAVGIVLVALFKGAGIGLSMGYIYIHYGVSGFLICALFILPWALITSFAVVVACREGLSFSLYLIRAISPAENAHLWQIFHLYALRFVVCFGLAALAALIEAGSTIAFSALFFSA